MLYCCFVLIGNELPEPRGEGKSDVAGSPETFSGVSHHHAHVTKSYFIVFKFVINVKEFPGFIFELWRSMSGHGPFVAGLLMK